MKAKVHASNKSSSGSSLSELLRNGTSEEKGRVFKSVIDSANASQRKMIDSARNRTCCQA